MVRVHFGPPLLKESQDRGKDLDDRGPKAGTPKWTRKAALDNMPVACCNRRGFPAGKRVLGPPHRQSKLIETRFAGLSIGIKRNMWGVSSAGRAPALQAGGHRFDPGTLHQEEVARANSSAG